MIDVKGLCIEYDNKKVIDNLSFHVSGGECLVLFGPSGCGKTSILNAITNLIPYSGKIKLDGKASYAFQNPKIFKQSTIYDNLRLVCEDENKIDNYLKEYDLQNFKMAKAQNLSGGQKARVNIIRALLVNDILLLDEPFDSLDLLLKEKIISSLKMEIKKRRGTIFVTHSLDEALALGDNLIILNGKKSKEICITENTDKDDIIKALH